jgi:hypothetical protein
MRPKAIGRLYHAILLAARVRALILAKLLMRQEILFAESRSVLVVEMVLILTRHLPTVKRSARVIPMVFLYVAILLTESETAFIVATLRRVSWPETDLPTATSLLTVREILRIYHPIRLTANVAERWTETLRTNRAIALPTRERRDLVIDIVLEKTAVLLALSNKERATEIVFL